MSPNTLTRAFARVSGAEDGPFALSANEQSIQDQRTLMGNLARLALDGNEGAAMLTAGLYNSSHDILHNQGHETEEEKKKKEARALDMLRAAIGQTINGFAEIGRYYALGREDILRRMERLAHLRDESIAFNKEAREIDGLSGDLRQDRIGKLLKKHGEKDVDAMTSEQREKRFKDYKEFNKDRPEKLNRLYGEYEALLDTFQEHGNAADDAAKKLSSEAEQKRNDPAALKTLDEQNQPLLKTTQATQAVDAREKDRLDNKLDKLDNASRVPNAQATENAFFGNTPQAPAPSTVTPPEQTLFGTKMITPAGP